MCIAELVSFFWTPLCFFFGLYVQVLNVKHILIWSKKEMKLFAFVDSNATYFFSLQLKHVARFLNNIWVYDSHYEVHNNIFGISIIAVDKIFPRVG